MIFSYVHVLTSKNILRTVRRKTFIHHTKFENFTHKQKKMQPLKHLKSEASALNLHYF